MEGGRRKEEGGRKRSFEGREDPAVQKKIFMAESTVCMSDVHVFNTFNYQVIT